MSLSPERIAVVAQHNEVMRGMQNFTRKNLVKWMPPVDSNWQPADFLADFSKRDWVEQVKIIQQQAAEIPAGIFIVVAGNTITEDTIGAYQTELNRIDSFADETGIDQHPMAIWTRRWIGQEARHGVALNGYLTLTGRVNMRAVQKTSQYLVVNGFNSMVEGDPYLALIYTSEQERATRRSHGEVAKAAHKYGDRALTLITGKIAGEERTHEGFYTDQMGEVFRQDPEGAIIAFRNLARLEMVMPAARMSEQAIEADLRRTELFNRYAAMALACGIYTPKDYAEIILHFIETWNIPHLSVSGEAAKAQDFFAEYKKVNTPELLERRNGVFLKRAEQRYPVIVSSWIYGEPVNLTKAS